MLRHHFADNRKVHETCKIFGFSRETYNIIYNNFKKYGMDSFFNKKPGAVKRSKVTPEITGYIIGTTVREPKLSGEQVAKKVRKHFNIKISNKTVERELKKHGYL